MQLYNEIFHRLELTEEDAMRLRKKRGFSDETITKAGLKSAQPLNEKLLQRTIKSREDKELIEAGVLNENGKLNKLFTQAGKVIIPFYEEGEIEYFRAHMYGPPNISTRVYIPRGTKSDYRLTLAESEFKALAMQQWGFQALGLCGISTFAGKKFGELEKVIESLEPKKVIFLWDNEIKNQRRFEKYYKPNPNVRYWVEYYQFIMARAVAKLEKYNVFHAKLPDDWLIDGGIDLDGALAHRHTSKEIDRVLKDAVSTEEWRKSWSKECKQIITRKIKRFFFSSPVYEYNNSYFRALKDSPDRQISNFIIKVRYNFVMEDGTYEKAIIFIEEGGRKSPVTTVDPSTMSNTMKFKTWISKMGNYWYAGSQTDLDEINKRIVEFNDGDKIYTPFCCGYHYDTKGYVFNNCYIKKGSIYEVSKDDGIVWAGDQGFKAQSLNENKQKGEVGLYTGPCDFRNALKRIARNWHGYNHILGIGWSIAVTYADAISDAFGKFPLLIVGGIKESGKTSLCDLITSLHGVDGLASNAEETTRTTISRELEYYSNLPVWINEYRPTNTNFKKWDSLFRSIYDRQGAGKSLRWSKKIRKIAVKACLVIDGEASPADSALMTRCIHVILNHNSIEGSEWKWLTKNKHKFSAMHRELARDREKVLPGMLERIEETKNMLNTEYNLSHRHALNYGIIIGAIESVIPDIIDEQDKLLEWIVGHAEWRQTESNSEHILSQFLRNLAILKSKGKVPDDVCELKYNKKKDKHYIYVEPYEAYDLWTRHLRDVGQKPTDGFTVKTIRNYMKHGAWKTVTKRKEDGGYSKWLRADVLEVYNNIDSISRISKDYLDRRELIELCRETKGSSGEESEAEEE